MLKNKQNLTKQYSLLIYVEEYLKVSSKTLILQKMEFTLKWILQHKQTNILTRRKK
jgi:hypothetical protein